jgi:ribonucleotide monophosphatase NagD (HAD superfamily)
MLTVKRMIAEQVDALRHVKLRRIVSLVVTNDGSRSHEVFLLPLELAARIALDVKDDVGVKQRRLTFQFLQKFILRRK